MRAPVFFLTVFSLLSVWAGAAVEDPGRAKIAWVEVTVYHGVDQIAKGSAVGQAAPKEACERMRSLVPIQFKHYTVLGRETQPLLRSYETWSKPIRNSEEVLVRFEAQGKPTRKSAILDLELWLSRKKILKTDARLQGGQPLYVLGPEYRGGHLIVAVALASEPKTAQ